jgi:hypothetical protein
MLIISRILTDQPCAYRLVEKLQGLRYRPIFNEYVKASYLSDGQDHSPKGHNGILAFYLSAPKYLPVIY